ncbi:MAG: tRNA lysidine(34) synthetase TilS, partial [Acidobacteriales bacterium]|nr:tRNA lysidine(34) synthetase TilS [Terriglobales bacterium]
MSVLAGNLVDRVGEIIPRYSMLCAGDRIGVAVSGGADSVALLHILHGLSSRFAIHLTVLHVNHQLRGRESDGDEASVRALAASFGLDVVVSQAPIQGGNLEQEARRARLDFFRSCMATKNLQRVALGHTRSDQAETVLFHLLRGCGLAGLAGMRPVTSDGLIRPLLGVSRQEIREWARAEGIEWREDSSNADLRFARNRLRNESIPALTREFNTNLEGVLAGIA